MSSRMIFLSLAVFLLAGAGNTAGPADHAFRFRLNAEPTTLDWNLAESSHETYVIMNLMEGLVEEGNDLKPHPALAERWQTSADGRTLTFDLRPGVKWSDGRPLVASDFVDSWLRLLSGKTKSSYAAFLFDIENAEAYHAGQLRAGQSVGIKAISDNRLQIRLRESVPYFIHLLSFWVTFPIRQDLITKYGSAWATPGKIVTLGPYLLTDWNQGKLLRLKKNPGYYGARLFPGFASNKIDTIEAVVDADDARARSLFQQEKIDILLNATTGDLLGGQAPVLQFPYLATWFLGFNVKAGPLKDPAIRRALAQAIDRQAIPAAMQGGQIAAKGWIPPGMEGYDSGASLTGSLYDARGAMMRAGYEEGNRFPKLRLYIYPFDGAEKLGRFLAQAFSQKLGITVDVKHVSEIAFQAALRGGSADLFVRHWGADIPDLSNFFDVFLAGSGNNKTHWVNSEYDRLVAKARTTIEPDKRLTLYASAERILLEKEVAIVPLFYKKSAVLVGPRIKEFSMSPLNYLFVKNASLK